MKSNRSNKKPTQVSPKRRYNSKQQSPDEAQDANNSIINESGKHLLGAMDPPIIQQSILEYDDLLKASHDVDISALKDKAKRIESDLRVDNSSHLETRIVPTVLDKRQGEELQSMANTMFSGNNNGHLPPELKPELNGSLKKSGSPFVKNHRLKGNAENETGQKSVRINVQKVNLVAKLSSRERDKPAGSDTSTTAAWKEKYDYNQVYNLEKSFTLSDPLDAQRRELARWNGQDIKGSRRTQYTKEVLSLNQDILTVVKQSRLEQVNNYTDGHKCLPFRKKIMRFRVLVSNYAQMITTSRYFEAFIISIIGLNCITLAQSDSTVEDTPAQKRIELAFQVIYTIEMILRIFSLGFIFNKGAYLRSPWNQLDFITVMTGFTEMIGVGDTSLAGLRAFRVLRPLRAINQIEGLRIIVQSVMAAIPLLQDTLLILVFFMLIFAIGGLNLFMGMLMQRCVHIESGLPMYDEEGEEVVCSTDSCPVGYFCGKRTLNPNYDVSNFDNIFWALLNVFQCITLEGWSEIMVMYQKAYTPIVFFFFVSLVFIGAFFFLNLTLAVINSSYSEAQARIKAQKEKLKAEQNIFAMKDSSNGDNATTKKKGGVQLGLAEFFVAKRAAIKLKAFWKRHQIETKAAEEEAKQASAAEREALKQAQIQERNRRQVMLEKQKQKQKLQRSASIRENSSQKGDDNKSEASKDFQVKVVDLGLDGLELSDMRDIFQSSMQKPISEEDDQGDDFSQDVQQFLQEINNEQQVNEAQMSIDRGEKLGPINAFLDARVANRSPLRLANAMESRMENNLSKRMISQTITKGEGEVSQDDQHIWMLKELDFDAVVGKRPEKLEVLENANFMPQSARVAVPTPKAANLLAKNDYYLPFDIGAVAEQNIEPAGVVAPAPKAGANGSYEDLELMSNFPSSIISSDDSIGKHLESIVKDNNAEQSNTIGKNMRKQKQKQKEIQSKQIGHKLRRMLTGDFINDHNRSKEGLKQQIDLMSSLQLNNSVMGRLNQASISQLPFASAQRNQAGSPLKNDKDKMQSNRDSQLEKTKQKVTQARHSTVEIYRQIDEEKFFDHTKPKDPYVYMDPNQKVIINPGVPYVSTSQNEIFERRILLNQQELLAKQNAFIKPADVEEEEEHGEEKPKYEDVVEDVHITSNFGAHQLKTQYKVKKQEEIEWDDDDEDALILAQQPFETVMQVGFKDFLNHLSTKFIARRSDIIVSSTLSITLTPEDDGFVPSKFGIMDKSLVDDYIDNRNTFRSLSVTSNSIPKKGNFYSSMDLINPAFQDSSDSEFGAEEILFEEFQDVESLKSSVKLSNTQEKTALPPTLLTAPLPPRKVALLREKDKKLYNIQKAKYEVVQKSISKKAVHPADTMFSLDDAKQLIEGNYHLDEDEIIQGHLMIEKEADAEHRKLNRAMNNGIKDFQTELELENFEEKIILEEVKQPTIGVSLKSKGDHIPHELKEAFNLPENMKEYDIDFNQVRIVDALFKRRIPVWSGQDVLDIGLNLEKSNWVLQKINKVRVWPKGFYNKIKKARVLLKTFVKLSIFENFLTLCVLVNTIGMAMDSYDIDEKTKEDLEFLNVIFTWIFIVEMALRLLARGPKKYAAERMNLLDGAVVILSIVEMIMESLGGGGGAGNLQAFRTVRVFRTFRVLRVTRILRSLQSMAMIIGVIQRAFMDFILITVLMFVFIFIYTLLGRQIFQGNYDFGPDEELPRGNYETFTVAFVTVFQVLTMENWQSVLYVSMRAAQGSMISKTITAIFYITWIFIGNFILLNLFLAILIDSFGEADAELELTDEQRELEEQKQIDNSNRLQAEKEKRMKKLGTSMKQLQKSKSIRTNTAPPKPKKTKASFTGGRRLFNENIVEEVEDLDNKTIRLILIDQGLLKPMKGEIDQKLVGPEIFADNSVYLFNRDSCFRRNIHFIQKHRYFERFIMLLIALSSTKLALESYIRDEPADSMIVKVSNELDFVFNYLFIIEMILKIIALGFAMDDGSYLRDSWNGLDFFIVVTSIIDMALQNTDIPALKVLRLLRMIRPLRVISHNPQLKMIVAALFESVGSIVNVSVVVVIIWLMFAIYGMNTYMGMFFYCSEDPYKLNTKWVCEDNGGEWLRFDSNFDDIGQAMVTLFVVSSLEGWPDIMYQAIDITKRDNGPKYEAAPAQSAFFIVFILIGSFFFLNFFIGVLFLKYEQAQKKEEAGFNKTQLYWLEIQQLVVRAQTPHELRYRPQQNPRLAVWKMIQTNAFEMSIMACIVLNMLQMALDHEGRSESMVVFLQMTNYFFTGIFLFEAVVKLYVFRLAYFKTAWNKFDFFVVCSSLIDLGLEFAIPEPEGGNSDEGSSQILTVGPQLARVLRVLRVSRVLRLAGKYKGLQSLLKTIQMSVSSLINVFILLMLIFFIMAVLGNSLFFEVTDGNVISEWKNFTNFHQSFSLLFSISTGEDWNRIMYDCTKKSGFAIVFFLTFIVVVSYVMLNLFILVIIQQFSKYYLEDDNPLSRFEEDFEDFKDAWKLFTDKYQCTKISLKNLDKFFKKLPMRIRQKISLNEDSREVDIQRIIIKMGITVDDGFIYFNEMLYRLMRAQFGNVKMNKVMALNELVTQFKITEHTILAKEEVYSQLKKEKSFKENIFFSQLRAASANPFLTQMYYRTSFKTWQQFVRRVVQRQLWEREVEKDRERHKTLGKVFIEPEFMQEKPMLEDVEIEREVIFEMTCSSDQGGESQDDRSRKSGTMTQKYSLLSKKEKESPQDFRKKAKRRIDFSQKKFTITEILKDGNTGIVAGEEVLKTAYESKFSQPSPEKIDKMAQQSKKFEAQSKVALNRKFNSLEKRKLRSQLNLKQFKLEPDEYKGKYASKETKLSPKSGLNGPFAQKKKSK